MNLDYYIAIEFPEQIVKQVQYLDNTQYGFEQNRSVNSVSLMGGYQQQIPGSVETKIKLGIPESENNSMIMGFLEDWMTLIMNSTGFYKGTIAAVHKEDVSKTQIFHGIWIQEIEDHMRILGEPDSCRYVFSVDYETEGINDFFKFVAPQKLTYEFCLDLVMRSPNLIKYIPDQFKDQEMVLVSKIS